MEPEYWYYYRDYELIPFKGQTNLIKLNDFRVQGKFISVFK